MAVAHGVLNDTHDGGATKVHGGHQNGMVDAVWRLLGCFMARCTWNMELYHGGGEDVSSGLTYESSGGPVCLRSASVTCLGEVGALSWRRGALWKHGGGSMKGNVMVV